MCAPLNCARFSEGPDPGDSGVLRADRPGHPERHPKAPLRRRHPAADGLDRRGQHAHRSADRLFHRRRDGHADGARACSSTGRRAAPARSSRSFWCANWGRCWRLSWWPGAMRPGIASELGSMKVTEQIDAMRALGTDPIQKLVTPRMIATALMLPCLTVIDDFVGMIGGWVMARSLFGCRRGSTGRWSGRRWCGAMWRRGWLKPFIFSFAISLIGCFYGLRATRRHAGRGPRHHAGDGRGIGSHLHSGLFHRQDLRRGSERR